MEGTETVEPVTTVPESILDIVDRELVGKVGVAGVECRVPAVGSVATPCTVEDGADIFLVLIQF